MNNDINNPDIKKNVDQTIDKGSRLYEESKDKAAKAYEQGREKVETAYQHVKESASDLYEESKRKVSDVQDSLQDYSDELIKTVKDKPLISLLVAGGIGFILSSLLKSK